MNRQSREPQIICISFLCVFSPASTLRAQPAATVYEWSWNPNNALVRVEAQVFADVADNGACFMGDWGLNPGPDCPVPFAYPPNWTRFPVPIPPIIPQFPTSDWDYKDDISGAVVFPPCWEPTTLYVGPYFPSPSSAADGTPPVGPGGPCDLGFDEESGFVAPIGHVIQNMYRHPGLAPELQISNGTSATDDNLPIELADGWTNQIVTYRSRRANPDFVGMAPGSVPSSRTWELRSKNDLELTAFSERFAVEGAGTIVLNIPIELIGLIPSVPARVTFDFEVFADAYGNAKELHVVDPAVFRPDADNAYAFASIDLFTNTAPGPGHWTVPFRVFAGDPPAYPEAPWYRGVHGITLLITPTPTQTTYELILRVTSRVRAYLEDQQPLPLADTAGAALYINCFFTAFGPPVTPRTERVPASTDRSTGPDYDFWIGKYEVTNIEFVDFLNDAEQDASSPGGGTAKSANMIFDPTTGTVMTPGGVPLFEPIATTTPSGEFVQKIRYRPYLDPGTRYVVDPHAETEAIVGVTWFGAIKYCNWLTLNAGYPVSERCYTEGFNEEDWHPVTISSTDWAVRDLLSAERDALVRYRGYRLPMDNVGGWNAIGFVGNQVNRFNEWYKASAYDPNGPTSSRTGPNGEVIPARHWVYGFGRDAISDADANYYNSGDPWDEGISFVGYFDGVTQLPNGTTTNDTNNPYGLYDLAGNVDEWGQDQFPRTSPVDPHFRATRAGAFWNSAGELAATRRWTATATDVTSTIGFRVLTTFPPHCTCGDLDGSGGPVDLIDFTLFASCFNQSPGSPTCSCADLNGDQIVDLLDFSTFVGLFGQASTNRPPNCP